MVLQKLKAKKEEEEEEEEKEKEKDKEEEEKRKKKKKNKNKNKNNTSSSSTTSYILPISDCEATLFGRSDFPHVSIASFVEIDNNFDRKGNAFYMSILTCVLRTNRNHV